VIRERGEENTKKGGEEGEKKKREKWWHYCFSNIPFASVAAHLYLALTKEAGMWGPDERKKRICARGLNFHYFLITYTSVVDALKRCTEGKGIRIAEVGGIDFSFLSVGVFCKKCETRGREKRRGKTSGEAVPRPLPPTFVPLRRNRERRLKDPPRA